MSRWIPFLYGFFAGSLSTLALLTYLTLRMIQHRGPKKES